MTNLVCEVEVVVVEVLLVRELEGDTIGILRIELVHPVIPTNKKAKK
jgi:hypothetical protein